MRKLLLVGLAGCWSGTSKPAEAPKPASPEAPEAQIVPRPVTIKAVDPAKPDEQGAFASLTGTGDLSSGFDDTDIYGGLIGNEGGDAAPAGGSASGGGTGWGTIGTGRYGTIGHGSGTSGGYGVGGKRTGLGGKRPVPPNVSIGQPSSDVGLDKAIIRRYIKRNIQKIQYCYEKELLGRPTLTGTVTVKFTIGLDGLVSAAMGAGMAPVDRCVADVVRALEFPKPTGGAVNVSYPFVFRPGE
jgi:outer membrane biosynthesis protein TonB